MKYIKGKGILIGKFTEEELINKVDKKVYEEKSKQYDMYYTNTFIIKENGIKKLALYLCNYEDIL